jgi:tRNA(fMet)-specific endonuclease VapC
VSPAYLLDSSVCVEILRNNAGLSKLPKPEETAIPVIVAAELWTGVKKNILTHPQKAARLQAFLGLFKIIDFTIGAAIEYAEIRADLEAIGTPIGPLDLLIGAQARSLGATLITDNTAEFRRIKGLKIRAFK